MPAARKARLDALGFIWDVNTADWEEGFQYLEAFVKEYRHCKAPQRYVTADGYRLGQWVAVQRVTKATIPPERKARLDTLGFIWDVSADEWEEGFRYLEEFVKEHGHCRVPQKYVTACGYRLGLWVTNQRARKATTLPERIGRLDALGFVWDGIAGQWEEGLKHLQAFVKAHGHCRVPRNHVTADGYPLGQWVTRQRQTRDSMSPERKAHLDALGFIWDARPSKWEEGFQRLQGFVNEHGHCRVRANYVTADGYPLGQWVSVQRTVRDTMPPERKARLDAIGFIWDVIGDQWENGFQHLQAFINEHRHSRFMSTRPRSAQDGGDRSHC
jgi:phage-related protein